MVDLVLVALAFRDLDRDVELHRATPYCLSGRLVATGHYPN